MRAAVLHTVAEAPSFRTHPDPEAAAGQSLVRVTAAPIVPLDQLCASGTSYFGRPAVPYVPGVQGVGVVERSDVLADGTRVWFASTAGMAPGDGAMAELCAVSHLDLIPVSADVDDAALAALGLSGIAAWMMLTWRGSLQPTERVLVLGGGGAVGQSAIGAARVLGAGRVVALCRSDEAAERARRAGAEEVVALSGDVDDLTESLRAACGGPVDLVIDPVFGPAATAACRVLAEHGRLVNLGGAGGDTAQFSSAVLRSRSASVLGYTNNALSPEQRAEALTAVADLAAAGRMGVAYEEVPLEKASEAWQRQASGESGVRLVLTP